MTEQIATVLLVAIVLGADAFSLSLGIALNGVKRAFIVKFVIVVTVLHILMPLIGLILGLLAGNVLGDWAAWLGASILAYIGFDFILKGYREIKPQSFNFKEAKKSLFIEEKKNYTGWISIIILGASVSLDALTVGFTLGTLKMPIAFTVIIMGITAGIMTWLGFISGRIVSRIIGSYAQIIGGVVLLLLAITMII